MESKHSMIYINLKKSSFLTEKYNSLINKASNNSDIQNTSTKSNNNRSSSTSAEEKIDKIIKRNSSYRNINLNPLIKRLKEHKTPFVSNFKSNSKKKMDIINPTIVNKNDNTNKFNFIFNFDFNINNKIRKRIKFDDFKKKDNIKLKDSPPKATSLFYYKYDLSKDLKNNNKQKMSIPHVFLNHLTIPNKLNKNTNIKYLKLACTARLKSKKLTILYYNPLK